MSINLRNITVLGAGAWGTALAQMSAGLGHHVRLYARDCETVHAINNHHVNNRYLPGIELERRICAYEDVRFALEGADVVLAVMPAQAMSTFLLCVRDVMPSSAPLILCAKGIEQGTRRFMSEVAREILPTQPLAVLSGPSFAVDVARSLPTAVTIAAERPALARDLAHMLSGSFFRCYASDDVIGVEMGGALKNVLALAAGVASGRGLGLSAQAALVTRGFAELRRLGSALGARLETMNGLAVLGDLMLTCSSPQSRNYSYGFALGQGQATRQLALAEGVATAPVAVELCKEYGIEAPIIQAVADLIAGRLDVGAAVEHLINRPLKVED